jgi:two-component system, LytTR family, sensor kinase
MTLELHDRRLFWVLQGAGWMAFGLVYALAELRTQPLRTALVANAIFAGTGCITTLAIRHLYRRFRRRGIAAIAVALAGSGIGAAVWYAADKLLFRVFGYIPWHAPWLNLHDPWANHYFLLTLAAVLMAWSALYFGVVHARDLQVARERTLISESLAREAQLRALRYQLSPHFLFNVLNAISTLVAEGEGAVANTMIARLGELLRATLDEGQPELSLQQELTLLDKYLAIERIRFGDRLQVTVEADPDVLDARVPALLLQPLVENAIRHGVARRAGTGRVAVSASRQGGRLRVVVTDDGPGWDRTQPQLGIGLRNVQERLACLPGDRCDFERSSLPSGGAQIVLRFPLRPMISPVASGTVAGRLAKTLSDASAQQRGQPVRNRSRGEGRWD